ncbi:hypothetical protein [Coleofasciculus sp. FACHB-1120]|nr:hypothetical protein [Coleofasciculus sp. FACHB-1120]
MMRQTWCRFIQVWLWRPVGCESSRCEIPAVGWDAVYLGSD